MDDYDINSLNESKNEWCIRLVNIFTPFIISGFKSILDESVKLCNDNNENSKYLMTFQNLLVNIPKWSQAIIEKETQRIIESSNCNYIEDLISCVHIIQLKALSACRVGIKQKKIDIQIPNINSFIHKVYINSARKLYLNIYLFEKNIAPLSIQKNNRELEIIIKEIILDTIRENIPIESLLKAYLDETEETDVVVEEKKETIIDEERLKEEKLKQKLLEENELKREAEKKTETKETNDKDILLQVNKSIEDMNETLPKSLNINNIGDSGDIGDASEETIGEKLNLDNISENKIETSNIENIEDTLKISSDEINNPLEIIDINNIDDKEQEISLDIEEL